MPVKARLKRGKYRIVEPGGRLVRSNGKNPVDGGGHSSREKALAQARAINRSMEEKNGRKRRRR